MPVTGSIIKIFYSWHTRSNVAIVQGARLHPKKVTKFECCQSGINFAGMKGARLTGSCTMVLENHWSHKCVAGSFHSTVPPRRPQELSEWSCEGRAEVVIEIVGCWRWQKHWTSTEERVKMTKRKAINVTGSRAGETGLPMPSGAQWFHQKSQMPNTELQDPVLSLLGCVLLWSDISFAVYPLFLFRMRTSTLCHHMVEAWNLFCNIIEACS